MFRDDDPPVAADPGPAPADDREESDGDDERRPVGDAVAFGRFAGLGREGATAGSVTVWAGAVTVTVVVDEGVGDALAPTVAGASLCAAPIARATSATSG